MSIFCHLLQMLKISVILGKNRGDILTKKVSKQGKRRLTLFVLIFMAIVTFMCVNIFPDWLKIMENNKELSLLELNYQDLLDNENALRAEVQKLQNPEYVERYAREKFLYTKDGELIIRGTP